MRLAFALVPLLIAFRPQEQAPRPHIVCVLIDDMGWKDVGYHGSEIRTPAIDKLAAAGARLEQFYVLHVCSPTRAAFLTGRYPIRYGLQMDVVRPGATYGIAPEERLLPQALREAGYRTAITGKWHLGESEAYHPTRRGFDHQYGHYLGALDYFTHLRNGKRDWYRDDRPLVEEGYTTDLVAREAVRLIEGHDPAKPLFLYVPFNATHSPLQAPPEYVERYKEIADRSRRLKAAMTEYVDEAVGRIVAALEKKKMWESTLFFFSSDNGGPLGKEGSDNGPLRGQKGQYYEGGVRVPAFAVWPGRIKPGTVVHEPLHVVDLYPSLLRLAGAPAAQKLPLDGRDLWGTLAEGKPSPHEEILVNAEPDRGALRRGAWKIVVAGPLPARDPAAVKIELFNLAEDPYEKTNLAPAQPEKAKELLERLNAYASEAAAPLSPRAKRK